MKVNLVSVGNSRGVRLPKAVIEQCGFGEAVELSVEDGRVALSRVAPAREGWAAAFDAAPADEGPLLPDDVSAAWDEAEWRWRPRAASRSGWCISTPRSARRSRRPAPA